MPTRLTRFLVLGISSLLVLALLVISVCDARHYAGIDLRTKVAGARLLIAHRNPYPSPDRQDTDEYFRMFNDDTYSPFLLALYDPLCRLPYGVQRISYLVLDWVALVFLFLTTRAWFSPLKRNWHCVAFMLLVIADFGVRLHMERGQYYLPIAALMAWIISAWMREESPEWSGAIALGLLILVRPTFVIVLPVLLLLRLRALAWRSAVVSFLLLAATLTWVGLQPWISYARTVSALQATTLQQDFAPDRTEASPQEFPQPKWAEGFDFSRSLHSNYAISRTFLSNLSQKKIRPFTRRVFKSVGMLSSANSVLLASSVLYCLLLAYALRHAALKQRLAFAFLAPIVIETFGPQRNAYCDVVIVPVLLLIPAFAFGTNGLTKRVRIGLAVGCGLCVAGSIGALALSAAGTLVEAVSLARWYGLLLLANLYFVLEWVQAGQMTPLHRPELN